MKILEFAYQDLNRNWQLEKMDFNKLTMLVGASGVGKTQILRAIMNLKDIATKGKSLNGAKWYIKFKVLNDDVYEWFGEFCSQEQDLFLDEENNNHAQIITENIILNNVEILVRTEENIVFNQKNTVKLSQNESIIHLLKSEDLIRPAYEGFHKIIYSEQTNPKQNLFGFRFLGDNLSHFLDKYHNLSDIQNSVEPIYAKLFLAYKMQLAVFAIIKERYTSIFPQVVDIKIDFIDNLDLDTNVTYISKNVISIQIKEKGVDSWIEQTQISSGMFRTLMQISEIYLSSEGSVILVDEFENSLGINCIDEMTNDILSSDRQLQFILTSHHPYIINNIPIKNWKIITRDKGIVTTHNADEFNIGKSRHEAFMQLLQLEEYQTGMTL